MSELWHGHLVHGPIDPDLKMDGCAWNCGRSCGARYGPAGLPVIHSDGCVNRAPNQNGKAPVGSLDEMYWFPRKEDRR